MKNINSQHSNFQNNMKFGCLRFESDCQNIDFYDDQQTFLVFGKDSVNKPTVVEVNAFSKSEALKKAEMIGIKANHVYNLAQTKSAQWKM